MRADPDEGAPEAPGTPEVVLETLDTAAPPSDASGLASTDASPSVTTASPPNAVSAAAPSTAAPTSAQGADEWLAAICPYLRSGDGTWRSTRPQRDHRCWAQTPPAGLPVLTQARLCLTPAHERCEVYEAATARRAQALAHDRIPLERLTGARFGAAVNTTPLTMEPSTQPPASKDVLLARRGRMVVLAGASIILLVLIAAAILGGPGSNPPPIADASPTVGPPSPTSASSATPALSPSVGRPSPSLRPTVAPTQAPASSATPQIARTYTVRPRDTLRRIARRFGITVDELLAVNDLGDPPTITPGQIINIPATTPAP